MNVKCSRCGKLSRVAGYEEFANKLFGLYCHACYEAIENYENGEGV